MVGCSVCIRGLACVCSKWEKLRKEAVCRFQMCALNISLQSQQISSEEKTHEMNVHIITFIFEGDEGVK